MPASDLTEIEHGLARAALFQVFSADQRRRLAASGQVVTLPAGALVCQKGDPGDAAYLVLEGELEIRAVAPNGDMVRLAALGRGQIAGEMALLDGGDRSADMLATRRTRLAKLTRAALLESLLAEPRAAVALIEALSQRLRETDESLEVSQFLDLGGRLSRLLLAEAGAQTLVPLTQGELAYRIGASREKVNRKLNQWAREGLVSVTRSGVRVLSPERLRASAPWRLR
jgi:CRP-like cAMP-binding protein